MIVDGLLPAAYERLFMIGNDALPIAAAALLRDLDKNTVVDSEGVLAWVELTDTPTSRPRGRL